MGQQQTECAKNKAESFHCFNGSSSGYRIADSQEYEPKIHERSAASMRGSYLK